MRIILLLAALTATTVTHAGFLGLTHHGRANCMGFNESVSWNALKAFDAFVVSIHYPDAKNGNYSGFHVLKTPGQVGRRHAAYHMNEAYALGTYIVGGSHYMKGSKNQYVLVTTTVAQDCSQYDGWWGL